jgi:hypothetical protein
MPKLGPMFLAVLSMSYGTYFCQFYLFIDQHMQRSSLILVVKILAPSEIYVIQYIGHFEYQEILVFRV